VTATCRLCGQVMPVELLLGHLRGAHDVDIELATWADGEPVVIDRTLEPADFEERT
jgi:hypothetical protein